MLKIITQKNRSMLRTIIIPLSPENLGMQTKSWLFMILLQDFSRWYQAATIDIQLLSKNTARLWYSAVLQLLKNRSSSPVSSP